MTFEDTFCPSPWIHMRITPSGQYDYCRWAARNVRNTSTNIKNESPVTFFQEGMAPIRQKLLVGEELPGCSQCRTMEQHKKVSGRQRQLLKIGVIEDHFIESLRSSPWIDEFVNCQQQQGITAQLPQDWQIDLGNYCNSACIFCSPQYSSRIAAEFKKIKLIDQVPESSWCEDPVLVNRFTETLKQTPHLQYLHFIGGETLITPAFKVILESLIDSGLNDTTIGFTTNLTV